MISNAWSASGLGRTWLKEVSLCLSLGSYLSHFGQKTSLLGFPFFSFHPILAAPPGLQPKASGSCVPATVGVILGWWHSRGLYSTQKHQLCMRAGSGGVLELTHTGLWEAIVKYKYCEPVIKPLLAWNCPQWKCLHPRNWQTLQIRDLPPDPLRQSVCQHTGRQLMLTIFQRPMEGYEMLQSTLDYCLVKVKYSQVWF